MSQKQSQAVRVQGIPSRTSLALLADNAVSGLFYARLFSKIPLLLAHNA